MSVQAQESFINWVKVNDPMLYEIAKARFQLKNEGLSGIADFFKELVTTVKEVAPSIVNMQAQKKILDVQVNRAKQGLPPLETAQYTPAIRVEPVINADTQRAAQEIAVKTVQQGIGELKVPLLLGAGLIAFMLLKKR